MIIILVVNDDNQNMRLYDNQCAVEGEIQKIVRIIQNNRRHSYSRKPLFNNGMFPTETSRALALLAKLNIFVSQAVPSRLMNKSAGVGALVSQHCTCVPTINYYNIGSGRGWGDTEVHREEQTLRRTQGLPGRS